MRAHRPSPLTPYYIFECADLTILQLITANQQGRKNLNHKFYFLYTTNVTPHQPSQSNPEQTNLKVGVGAWRRSGQGRLTVSGFGGSVRRSVGGRGRGGTINLHHKFSFFEASLAPGGHLGRVQLVFLLLVRNHIRVIHQ
jgi:hypothetical protein